MNLSIAQDRGNAIQRTFGKTKVAIGVVHCPALPGSPGYEGEPVASIYKRAVQDAEAYVHGGIDGLIIENHGDLPFLKPSEIGYETVAAMAVITERVRRICGVPIGINVLANAPIPALAIAKATGVAFVRVNQWANAYVANEGFIEGEAARVLRYRAAIGAKDIKVFADTHVKHGAHAIVADRSIAELTRDVEFFGADAVIATGQRTGDPVDLEELSLIERSTGLAVLVGSGVTPDNVEAIFGHADAVIIGSSLKVGGVWWGAVDEAKVDRFMAVVASCRDRSTSQ